MKFLSTRGKDFASNAAEAIVKGLAVDGGLYVPETFPDLSEKVKDMLDVSYAERAQTVIGSFLTEYDKTELLKACESAYSRFDENDPAPIVRLDEDFYVEELFHGPTLAFKDVALTLLPYLLRTGADIAGVKDEILILVATSGDTGKAALEGFKNAKGIKICVFYPTGGVSDMQKKQMSTQDGDNVMVYAVKGNFDDCQTAVKKIFSDKQTEAELKNKGVVLSSANSINFGRLVPQIVYYFSAYCDLVSSGEINLGDEVNFCVPTGNFGNILAGYYAKKMGLPVGKLICASNQNNVLTEFFTSGDYDANREFFKTSSPSMDILVSSNLERLIFELSGRDAAFTAERMEELKKNGKYSVSDKEKKSMDVLFKAGYGDESECAETIFNVFEEYGYVLDTHTAVAVKTFYDFRHELEGKTVVLSTASPYKFPQSVLSAITGKKTSDAFKAARELNSVTAAEIPQGIIELENKKVRFNEIIDKKDVFEAIKTFVSE
ncbi:MAG TPA: threonine synthase [Clostridiales bacterium]|nr:threonine synthase [Clostridiales bacterium]